MDILIINSLIVLNSLNSVMINYELFRRNFDSERLPYTITELLCGNCCCVAHHIWSADIEFLLVAASSSWLLCTRYHIVITWHDLWVDFPNYKDNKDHWGTGLIRGHNRMTHGGEYGCLRSHRVKQNTLLLGSVLARYGHAGAGSRPDHPLKLALVWSTCHTTNSFMTVV